MQSHYQWDPTGPRSISPSISLLSASVSEHLSLPGKSAVWPRRLLTRAVPEQREHTCTCGAARHEKHEAQCFHFGPRAKSSHTEAVAQYKTAFTHYFFFLPLLKVLFTPRYTGAVGKFTSSKTALKRDDVTLTAVPVAMRRHDTGALKNTTESKTFKLKLIELI